MSQPLDRIETALLGALEQDARLSYAELGERVGLSKSPCWSRVQELQRRGVITGYRAQIDPAAVGLALRAFVEVSIDSALHEAFEAAVNRNPAVIECYTTAGQADYVLHVLVPGINELDELLRTRISRLPGVQRLESTVCMKTIKPPSQIMGCLQQQPAVADVPPRLPQSGRARRR